MEDQNNGHQTQGLHRGLGLRDLVLFNVTIIVGLATLAQVAQLGYAAITLLFICVFTFLIPSGLVVAELNARMPEEGGFYWWVQKAFGDIHGYILAWCYWVCNIVWFSTALLMITIPALYILGSEYLYLSDNPWYNGSFGISIILLITFLNVIGIEKVKWVQNIGGVATSLCIVLLLIVGIFYAVRVGSPNEFSGFKLLPEFTDLEMLAFIALVPFSYGGLELTPVMAGEIKNPVKNIPRAIFYASIIVGIIYIAGTTMLLCIIPNYEIDPIAGVAQAFLLVDTELGVSGLGTIGGLLVFLATIGVVSGWMTGNARIPFVIGLDHYLPESFARLHPKYGSPTTSLYVQAIVVGILLLASIAGSSITEAYFVLLDMSVILYFIPFLYLFAAFGYHLIKTDGSTGIFSFFKSGHIWVWMVSIVGFLTTLVAIIFTCIPSSKIEDKPMFLLKVIGGTILIVLIGLTVYFRKRIKTKKLK